MKNIKAKRNIWGNWNIFIGTRNEAKFGERWNAVDWINDKLDEGGFQLSPNSDITQEDVDAYRSKLGEPIRRA